MTAALEALDVKAQKSTGKTKHDIYKEVVQTMKWDNKEKETVKITLSLQALGYLMFLLAE